ncbi:hypothetical protein FA95DRAFT_967763 [Auriscalpium vulgare]|uniref:Uncharacterized protein n=1 Tax=Auriscalpium vulgare TaxID=40419 RepID=A0ACB8R7H2_9AGAM|nr:hypothetical protein FA95DRAFT_967763 [Auriscalpium vulgare]
MHQCRSTHAPPHPGDAYAYDYDRRRPAEPWVVTLTAGPIAIDARLARRSRARPPRSSSGVSVFASTHPTPPPRSRARARSHQCTADAHFKWPCCPHRVRLRIAALLSTARSVRLTVDSLPWVWVWVWVSGRPRPTTRGLTLTLTQTSSDALAARTPSIAPRRPRCPPILHLRPRTTPCSRPSASSIRPTYILTYRAVYSIPHADEWMDEWISRPGPLEAYLRQHLHRRN